MLNSEYFYSWAVTTEIVADEKMFSRRRFLGAIGAASASLAGCTAPTDREISVEIALSEGLARKSREEKDYGLYPAEVMGDFARRSLDSLLPGGYMENLEIVYSDENPPVGRETAEDAIERWAEISDTDHSLKLLVTDSDYPDAVGVAERASDPFESSYAVLGEGYDLLRLEKDDWREEVAVSKYEEEELSRETVYTPFKTAVAGIHEIGHGMGLGHVDGEGHVSENQVNLSVMASSYLEQHIESSEARFSDIYWSPTFCRGARDKIRGYL